MERRKLANCHLCASEDGLTKCPICLRQVCLDDLLVSSDKDAAICMACRVDQINANGSGLSGQDPFTESSLPADEETKAVPSGSMYRLTPFADTKFRDFSLSLKPMDLLLLKQTEQDCLSKSSLAKHIHIFRQQLTSMVEDELHRRIGTARKRRELKKRTLAIEAGLAKKSNKARKVTPSKLTRMAQQLARAGITAEQLTNVLEGLRK